MDTVLFTNREAPKLHMTPTQAHKDLPWDRINAALNWDLSRPIRFLVEREGKDPAFVEQMAAQYRRFLGIIAAYPDDRFPISEMVDEMWHTHILFTRDYVAMSLATRGEYINHDPVLDAEHKASIEPYYHKGTLIRYRELYGESAPRFWWPITKGAICWSGYEIVPHKH